MQALFCRYFRQALIVAVLVLILAAVNGRKVLVVTYRPGALR